MINKLTIHCSDTPNGCNYTIGDIDIWHKARGFRKVGYNWVIHIDGSLHEGRHETEIGAHVAGHNRNNIGVCLIGRDKFNDKQIKTLVKLIQDYEVRFPDIKIYGHYELDSYGKTCPNFDVKEFCKKYNL
jgi:N-acetylmuramoyl-L-alanine amidase